MAKAVFTPGFSLAEALIALTLLGILSTLTITIIASNNMQRNGLVRTKMMAEMLLKARTTYRQSLPNSLPQGYELADLTRYTDSTHRAAPIMTCPAGMTLDSIQCTGSGGGFGGGCFCYRFSDGGILRADNDNARPDDVIKFVYDPDGAAALGNLSPVAFRLYFNAGRITTMGADTGVANNDPMYVREWSRL